MDSKLFDLTGRVAIVTGAGRGLGRAMAQGLAAHGARVVVAGRTATDVEETVRLIESAGHAAKGAVFDARSRDGCRGLVETAVAAFGGLDVLVVNHGVGRSGPTLAADDAVLDEVIDINLTSAFVMAQEGARRMIEQGRGGSIVFTSSTSSMAAFDGLAIYGVSKGGVDQMCRQFALELGPHGIRVNCINPGYTSHRMRRPDGAPPRPPAAVDPREEETIRATHPLGRVGDPWEFMGPVVFFASDASSYVTGHVMPVDGGYVAL